MEDISCTWDVWNAVNSLYILHINWLAGYFSIERYSLSLMPWHRWQPHRILWGSPLIEHVQTINTQLDSYHNIYKYHQLSYISTFQQQILELPEFLTKPRNRLNDLAAESLNSIFKSWIDKPMWLRPRLGALKKPKSIDVVRGSNHGGNQWAFFFLGFSEVCLDSRCIKCVSFSKLGQIMANNDGDSGVGEFSSVSILRNRSEVMSGVLWFGIQEIAF